MNQWSTDVALHCLGFLDLVSLGQFAVCCRHACDQVQLRLAQATQLCLRDEHDVLHPSLLKMRSLRSLTLSLPHMLMLHSKDRVAARLRAVVKQNSKCLRSILIRGDRRNVNLLEDALSVFEQCGRLETLILPNMDAVDYGTRYVSYYDSKLLDIARACPHLRELHIKSASEQCLPELLGLGDPLMLFGVFLA